MTQPSFQNVVGARRSVRSFLPTPISQEQIESVLHDAQRAPSNCNTQPWIVHIVSGSARAGLSSILREHAEHGKMSLDFSWDESAFPGQLDQRRREQGRSYYQSLGIARDDTAGRRQALMRNLDFFGAPHAAFLFMPQVGDGVRMASDVGMYAQTLLLSLASRGFAGIPQTVLGMYAEQVRDFLGVADGLKLLFGISFGHPDPDHTEHAPYMERASLEECVLFHS